MAEQVPALLPMKRSLYVYIALRGTPYAAPAISFCRRFVCARSRKKIISSCSTSMKGELLQQSVVSQHLPPGQHTDFDTGQQR